MKIIGSQITKISGEKFKTKKPEKLKGISSNINITNIDERTDLPDGNKIMGVDYKYEAKYELEGKKDLAVIECEGEVVFAATPDEIKDVKKQWKKDKKVPESVYVPVTRLGFETGLIEALTMSRKLALPPPIPLMRMLDQRKK